MSKYRFLDVESEVAETIRGFDWSSNAVGPIEAWPSILKTTVGLILRSAFPTALVWGNEHITFHNDAFLPILGRKPSAIGRPFSEVWSEVWSEIGPIADDALRGKATFIANFPLVISRKSGADERAFFTFCYSPVVDEEGRILGFLDTVIETTEPVLAQERTNIVNTELAHRIRNVLTLVGSIVSQSVRSVPGTEQIEAKINKRLLALANVQDVLRSGTLAEAEIHGIVETALAPHAVAKYRVRIEGPALRLSERTSLALALALNELFTNAIKYGALSNETGTVSISWRNDSVFYFVWQEYGGPPVQTPRKTGFGSRLIQRHVAATFDGTADIRFKPAGIVYEIRAKAKL